MMKVVFMMQMLVDEISKLEKSVPSAAMKGTEAPSNYVNVGQATSKSLETVNAGLHTPNKIASLIIHIADT
jgi:hypothetical protein